MANKLFTYMIVTVTIWVFLSILGITITGSFFANALGLSDTASLANIEDSLVWVGVMAALATLTAGIVIIGILTKSMSFIPASSVLAIAIFGFIASDMISLVNEIGVDWLKTVMWAILVPWIVGFILALFEWARGTD